MTYIKYRSALIFRWHGPKFLRESGVGFFADNIKPIIDYSVSVWALHTNQGINQLNSIRHRGARFVMYD